MPNQALNVANGLNTSMKLTDFVKSGLPLTPTGINPNEIEEAEPNDPLDTATKTTDQSIKALQDKKKRLKLRSKQKQAQKLRTDLSKSVI